MTFQRTHENYVRDEPNVPGSDRSFGIVMAVAFGLLAGLNWWHNGRVWPWMGCIAGIFLTVAYVYPAALRPFNWVWFKFGMLLHAVINPIVMALLFFVAVWPTGLVMRALGRDLLRLKRDPDMESYWIIRSPPGPAPETMKDQF
jgi:large-conductance mechanosensitive channel